LITRTAASFVDVRILEVGNPSRTDEKGFFDAFLPDRLTPGKDITFEINKDGYVIQNPLDGQGYLPADLTRHYPILLIKQGLLQLLSGARVDKITKDSQEKVRDQVNPQQERDARVDPSSIYREEARRLGLPAEQVEQAVQHRAKENRNSSNLHQRALAAIADNNLAEAASYFKQSSIRMEQELQRMSQSTPARPFRQSHRGFQRIVVEEIPTYDRQKLVSEIVKEYRMAGHAYYNSYKFYDALDAYQKASGYVDRAEDPYLWAAVESDVGRANTALAIRTRGDAVATHLAVAVAAYREALSVYSQEPLTRQSAATHNSLGNALKEQALRADGRDSVRLLDEAVAAFRQALAVYSPAQLPQEWAMTQNNLGIAFKEQALRAEGRDSLHLLDEAVAAFQQALGIYSPTQSPQQWAATQNNLGNALKEQALRAQGNDSLRLLDEAVAAFRQALAVYSPAQLPQEWAMTQNNLGNALKEQALRAEGNDSLRLLGEAVAAFQQALGIYSSTQLPQQWAATQNNLGIALKEQALRAEGRESLRLLDEAVAAFQQALGIYSRTQSPQQWAATQNNLGISFKEQALRAQGNDSLRLLDEAVAAFQRALEVRTLEAFPAQWAETQNNLAQTYEHLQDWPKAATSYTNVLRVHPDHVNAYVLAYALYQEKLFAFSQAFTLTQQWLERHPSDMSAQANFAEALFTTGQFARAEIRIIELLGKTDLRPGWIVGLRALEIASRLAQDKSQDVRNKLTMLRDFIADQHEGLNLEWTFEGAKYFVRKDERLASHRPFLLALFTAIERENRNSSLEALDAVRATCLPACAN
jgi:tetratricopeptide (TPR) repeat protein